MNVPRGQIKVTYACVSGRQHIFVNHVTSQSLFDVRFLPSLVSFMMSDERIHDMVHPRFFERSYIRHRFFYVSLLAAILAK